LFGSLLAERLAKRAGLGRVIVGAQILFTLAMLTIPLAGYQFHQTAMPQALWGFATVVYVVNTVSLRQRIPPNQFLSRVATSLRFVTWGISPLGLSAGGLLGGSVGLQATLFVSGIGPILSVAVLIFSSVPGLREPSVSESISSPTTMVT
jgi:predicted MFS family arabinose efflux permease